MDMGSPAPPQRVLESLDRNAAGSESNSEYLQSVSSESSSFIMIEPKNRLEVPSRLWVTMVVVIVIVLQVASTTGLFIYLNMSVAQAQNQGVTEELRCLGLLNALEKEQEVPDELVQLFGEPCIKLAEGLKAYISKVTENIISKQTFQERVAIPPRTKLLTTGNPRPSAHLTLRDSGLQGTTTLIPQTDLHQSCRHPVRSWGNQSFGSHLHNMTVSDGRLRIPRAGRYYLYGQVYFRYLTLSSDDSRSTSVSHQVVQCVYKKTAYARPIQLLKGVGTKCWSPDSENALHSVYQGGLFELRAGDEIFISVSSPTAVYAEDSSSYFGAFLFDL
ncbi:tumor necrosis factor (ligand) superfamily, member 10 like 3 [Misgurnus anguillicaudatus]|uniref:tumor necrosis factor (ligand) superfamily, member 10 like 3 n=1 Tax=Misgurnus anguillicaudatus TaxID=75329 RepID=UPI002435D775|nr:tumor necrosis factor (ligand) superfamily, member 10 like 3 [Misgurnus anguillicaudatus]